MDVWKSRKVDMLGFWVSGAEGAAARILGGFWRRSLSVDRDGLEWLSCSRVEIRYSTWACISLSMHACDQVMSHSAGTRL